MDRILKGAKFLLWFKDPALFFRDIFKLEPYPYQTKVLRNLKNNPHRIIILAAGGTGKTRLLACIALWLTIVLPKFINRSYSVIIISGSDQQAKYLYEYSKFAIRDNEILAEEVEGEPLISITYFKDRSLIMAVPNSLKAIQGKHTDCVLVDEGALAGDFIIQDTLRIVSTSDRDLIILSGTPMIYGTMFVNIYEEQDRYPEWERFSWSAKECPFITLEKWNEASKLPEDMFCYDVNTEILTEDGWKHFNEITIKDKFCTLNPITNEIEYHHSTNIYIGKYKGKMYNLETRTLNLMVTPNHRMYVKRKNSIYKFRKAEDIFGKNFIFKKSGIWKGNNIDYFILPSTTKKVNKFKTINVAAKKLPIKEWLQFFGFWIAEGCTISTHNNLIVISNTSTRILEDIKDICSKLGFKASFNGNNLRIYSKQLYDYLKQFGKAHEKYIPKEIKNLDSKLLFNLYEYMMLGDGSQSKPNNKSYGTSSKRLADDFQEILLKIGKCGSISYRDPLIGKRSYRISILEHSNETAINFWSKYKTHEEWKDYNNIIWCVEVPNHLVYVRRNGKTVWSGNTIFWEGKPYAKLGTMIPSDEIRASSKDISLIETDPKYEIVAGCDWGWCLSADTEVLTEDSWRKLEEIKEGTSVLCLKEDLNTSEYKQIKSIQVKDYNGEMISIKSRNFEYLGKPRHIIPLLNRYKKNLHVHYGYENLTHHYLLRKARYLGKKDLQININGQLYDTKLFLKLLGWYLSEGSCEKTRFCISQSFKYNLKYCKEILQLGNDLKIHVWTDNYRRILFYDKNLRDYFKQLGTSYFKYIPKDIKVIDGELLNYLLETLLKGDGDRWFIRYNTYSKQLALDVQEIACKTGKYHSYISDRGRKGYRINFLERDSTILKHNCKLIKWKGKIASFEVPGNLIFTRYNGKVSYQHNRHLTTFVVSQLNKETDKINVLYVDYWNREEFEDMHKKIIQICKDFNVSRVFADQEDIGENQRLITEGINVIPITFKNVKIQMQSHMKVMFHLDRIRIPEKYQKLIQQLRKYNWNTSEDDDLVVALMLSIWALKEEKDSYYFEIL